MLHAEWDTGLKIAVPKMSNFLEIGLRRRKTGRLGRKRSRKSEAKKAQFPSIFEEILRFPSFPFLIDSKQTHFSQIQTNSESSRVQSDCQRDK